MKKFPFLFLFVALYGIVVALEWKFNFYFFRSLFPETVSMKVLTATNFMMTGVACYLLTLKKKSAKQPAVGLNCVVILAVFFAFMCALQHQEILPGADKDMGFQTARKGEPSISTSFLFMLIGFSNLISVVYFREKIRDALATIVFFVSFIALLGHLCCVPTMFYYIQGISTGMAFPTAVCFILLSIGLRHLEDPHLAERCSS